MRKPRVLCGTTAVALISVLAGCGGSSPHERLISRATQKIKHEYEGISDVSCRGNDIRLSCHGNNREGERNHYIVVVKNGKLEVRSPAGERLFAKINGCLDAQGVTIKYMRAVVSAIKSEDWEPAIEAALKAEAADREIAPIAAEHISLQREAMARIATAGDKYQKLEAMHEYETQVQAYPVKALTEEVFGCSKHWASSK